MDEAMGKKWNSRTRSLYDAARECVEEEVNRASDVFFVEQDGAFADDVLIANAAARSAYHAYGESLMLRVAAERSGRIG